MATVRMRKGDKYADVYDSPETIKQAQFEGYALVEQPKKEEPKKAEETPPAETEKAGKNADSEKAQSRTKR